VSTEEPLDCAKALVLLQDYLKSDLTPELVTKLEQHLDRCRPCFASAEFERRFVRMIATKAGAQCCPDHVRARIRAALADRPAPTA
jgi:anti-sigma factor (TIGR02949 family)